MWILRARSFCFALAVLLLPACSYYDSHGYGRVANSKLAQPTPLQLPPDAPSISQRFRPASGPANSNHRGFDILVSSGTPVLAAADGRVARVSISVLYGRQVLVNHDRGDAEYALQTRYFHLSEYLVSEGERVRRGQLLGYSGLSGLAGAFPHLHFEVHRLNADQPPRAIGLLDPQRYWVGGVGRVTCYARGGDFAPLRGLLTYPVPCRGVDWR
jgi:murein DD-endopeptidase MepM/ murein hydrolase activator NlpD